MGLAGFGVLAEGGGARGVRAVGSPSRRGHLGGEGLRLSVEGSRDQRQREGAPRLGGEQGGEEAERGVRGVRAGGGGVCVCVCVCVPVCMCACVRSLLFQTEQKSKYKHRHGGESYSIFSNLI